MDILINHTADVIEMAECDGYDCPYRSRADYPYSRRAADGAPINDGFAGDAVSSAENYARLTDPNFAYTVKVAPQEKDIKAQEWLKDPQDGRASCREGVCQYGETSVGHVS